MTLLALVERVGVWCRRRNYHPHGPGRETERRWRTGAFGLEKPPSIGSPVVMDQCLPCQPPKPRSRSFLVAPGPWSLREDWPWSSDKDLAGLTRSTAWREWSSRVDKFKPSATMTGTPGHRSNTSRQAQQSLLVLKGLGLGEVGHRDAQKASVFPAGRALTTETNSILGSKLPVI
jgi:hypothetical protein